MIENSMVGPPAMGFPGFKLKESAKDSREDGSGSFARTLGDKLNPKATAAPPGDKSPVKAKEKETEASPPQAAKPEKAETPGKERATTAREKAIRKFMDSFESEFGIPPMKIVEAMALLEPSEMNQAPEVTAESVIEQLGLDEDQEDEAAAMYASLLMNLQIIDQTKPKAFVDTQSAVVATPQIQERFLMGQEKKSTMNQTVERLNQKFWMTGATPNQAGAGAAAGKFSPDLANVMMDEDALLGDSLAQESLLGAELSDLNQELPIEGMEGPVPPPTLDAGVSQDAKAPSTDLQRLLQDMKREAAAAAQGQSPQSSDASLKSAMGLTATGGLAKAAPMNVTGSMATDVPAPSANALTAMMQAANAQGTGSKAFGGGAQGEKESSSGKNSEGDSKSLSDFKGMGATPVPLKMEDVAAALKGMTPASMAAMTMTPDDNQANVQQIMNQAKYLIQRGGGEVKVEMSPEGLGQVQLKILLQDGKVNVQMATESSEAKKAIEGSLSELKASLAAQKLSVDHIKIDVVSGPNTDQQARNDANPNGQRDSARQFWNQFQESFGNRGQREGMLELPSLKGYRQANRPDPLQPLEGTQKSTEKRTDGRGRGIDLVA